MQLHRNNASRDEAHMQTLKELAIPLLKDRGHGGPAAGNNGGSGATSNGPALAPSSAPRVGALPVSLQNIAYVSLLRQAAALQAAFHPNAAVPGFVATAVAGYDGGGRKVVPEHAHSFIGANGQPPVLAGGGGPPLGGGSVGGGVSAADLCGGPAAGWNTTGHVHGGNASAGALGQDLGASPYSLHYGGMCPDAAYRWFHTTPDMLPYSALGESS
ncbi:hypothetical protein HPB50_022762 [Hyalomma asiaticum]|uniref:Uncharacterized protein n=1 Tax=Hyalomma asiaticum TaxID=266040 RepID=A0ACB7RZK7_HYAAI|nr:hypothetical protein HPB50_022762 [Hyalomma asiaticum]